MMKFLTAIAAASGADDPPRSAEEKILDAIFGRIPDAAEMQAAATAASVDAGVDMLIRSLDRTEARLRSLQGEMWLNRRHIGDGLSRIRAANDDIETALKAAGAAHA